MIVDHHAEMGLLGAAQGHLEGTDQPEAEMGERQPGVITTMHLQLHVISTGLLRVEMRAEIGIVGNLHRRQRMTVAVVVTVAVIVTVAVTVALIVVVTVVVAAVTVIVVVNVVVTGVLIAVTVLVTEVATVVIEVERRGSRSARDHVATGQHLAIANGGVTAIVKLTDVEVIVQKKTVEETVTVMTVISSGKKSA